jgi:small subunit ribosomal protein S3
MGQKTNPISLRISKTKPWAARWFFPAKNRTGSAGKYPYSTFLEEDEAIRKTIRNKIGQAGIAGIEIERTSNNIRILIKAARPGLIIGQGGKSIEELARILENAVKKMRRARITDKQPINISVNVEELKRSEISAAYVAQQIAWELEKRMPFRWTMKKYLGQVSQNKEVKGVKITLSGRLDGAEIARRETMKQGLLPLQTLRADIDYGQATAFTTYGTVGVKIWIYKGEIFNKKE